MSTSPQRTPDHEFVHEAVEEVWCALERPTTPSADIEVVWALSSPGTVKTPGHFEEDPENPYNGESFNIGIVMRAVEVVVAVTAQRIGKPIESVTREDIRAHGPKLLYNGESPATANNRFPDQNADFLQLCKEEGFPLPIENIVIGTIDMANTPAQVKQLAQYMEQSGLLDVDNTSVAVVCGLPHLIRTGRYIEHHKQLFGDHVSFTAEPVEQGNEKKQSTLVALELRKARRYHNLGHLARTSIFFPNGATDTRPRNPLRTRRTR